MHLYIPILSISSSVYLISCCCCCCCCCCVVQDRGKALPAHVINHGVLPSNELKQYVSSSPSYSSIIIHSLSFLYRLLSESKLFVGLGFPYDGQSPHFTLLSPNPLSPSPLYYCYSSSLLFILTPPLIILTSPPHPPPSSSGTPPPPPPLPGPGPLEALAAGCVFLQPRFSPPHSKATTSFLTGKPTSRELDSQVPYLHHFVGEPYVSHMTWSLVSPDLAFGVT